jgi:hypothetical protein
MGGAMSELKIFRSIGVRHFLMLLLVLGVTASVQVVNAAGAQAIDQAPPQVNFKGMQYIEGSILSDSTSSPSLPVKILWRQYDPSGICTVSAELYNSTTRTYRYPQVHSGKNMFVRVKIDNDYSYRLRVYTADCLGNAGNSYDYLYLGSLYQETQADLSPGWTNANCLCWSLNSVFWNSQAGAKASFAFSGRSIAFITDRADNRGSAHIYIDGQFQKTINLQGAGVNRVVGFQKRFPSYENHIIDVVVVGTAGHPRVDVDAFLVA